MWFNQSAKRGIWADACRALASADERMAPVIGRVGPCTLEPRKDYFVALSKAIFSQQLSTKVAATLFKRFCARFPNNRPTPARVLELMEKDAESLRGCGLSRQKSVYIRDLADHFDSGKIPTRRLAGMEDEAIIEALTAVNGVGRWTAEMFLIFVLNRQDVLPVDDLGLREGVKDIFQLSTRPAPKDVHALCEHWRPYRSIATWYVWRRHSNMPIANK